MRTPKAVIFEVFCVGLSFLAHKGSQERRPIMTMVMVGKIIDTCLQPALRHLAAELLISQHDNWAAVQPQSKQIHPLHDAGLDDLIQGRNEHNG